MAKPALTKSAYVLLGMLSKGDSSGYKLKQLMTKVGSYYWSESNAQIYPVLKKLEQAGLVNSAIDPNSGGRKTRIFSITASGIEALKDWLNQAIEPTPYREEILLKISSAQHMEPQAFHDMIKTYASDIEQKLEGLKQIFKHINEEHQGRADQAFLKILYDHVQMVLEAKLSWAQKNLILK